LYTAHFCTSPFGLLSKIVRGKPRPGRNSIHCLIDLDEIHSGTSCGTYFRSREDTLHRRGKVRAICVSPVSQLFHASLAYAHGCLDNSLKATLFELINAICPAFREDTGQEGYRLQPLARYVLRICVEPTADNGAIVSDISWVGGSQSRLRQFKCIEKLAQYAELERHVGWVEVKMLRPRRVDSDQDL